MNFKICVLAFAIIIPALNCSQNVTAQEKKNQFFIGCTYALSFPAGNFADNSISNEDAGFAKKTLGIFDILLDAEFIFKNNLGVSSTYISEGYNIEQNGSRSNLDFSCITLGPTYSFAITRAFALNLKCHLGQVGSLLFLDGIHESIKGNGIGFDVRCLLRYQLYKHWCAIAQFGYFSSKQNFHGVPDIKIQALNAGLGIGFKIK